MRQTGDDHFHIRDGTRETANAQRAQRDAIGNRETAPLEGERPGADPEHAGIARGVGLAEGNGKLIGAAGARIDVAVEGVVTALVLRAETKAGRQLIKWYGGSGILPRGSQMTEALEMEPLAWGEGGQFIPITESLT